MEKRYLSNWNYNAALILGELETIVKNNGGEICSTWQHSGNVPKWVTERKQYLIVNRTLNGAIREETERFERLEKLGRKELATISCNRLEELNNINNEPIVSYHGDYLYTQFILNGDYYYYDMDRNPFFDFHFAKVKVEPNNTINRDYYIDNDKKEWLFDCFYSFNCSDADRKEAANLIFNMLVAAKHSTKYHNKNKPRYSNVIVLNNEV